jgi:hypothetical protein
MPRLSKEEKALRLALKQEEERIFEIERLALKQEEERIFKIERQKNFEQSLPEKLLTLIAKASKFSNRMQVDYDPPFDNDLSLMITFWDKKDRYNYVFTLRETTKQMVWELQELEELLDSYAYEERIANEKLEAKKVALSKLTEEEKKLLGL